MQVSMSKIKEMVDVSTVIGDPVAGPDGITLVPISTISYGFGSGGSDLTKGRGGFGGGSGAAIRVEPMGFLIIKDGCVKMLNITPPASNVFERVVDLVPNVLDRVENLIDRKKG